MHVVMFGDQHLDSSGGAQVSMRLQRQFLELAGHTVSVVAPRMHANVHRGHPGDVDTPSVPVTLDREYSLTWPGRRADRFIDDALAGRPAVDVVHVQADFWGAFLGHRFAARHALPVVHTMHNRVDVGVEAVSPVPGLTLRALNAWARAVLPRPLTPIRGIDGWAFLRRISDGSAAVTAPSSHFARRLEEYRVFPRVDVVWNGIDDALLDDALAADAPGREGPARLIWIGRMSPEKRLLPFLEAVAESGVDAQVEIVGGGGELAAARRLVARLEPRATVEFAGRMPYPEALRRLRRADAVVQTSIGFETQGMTVFEAAALGTPSIVSDPDIAAELGAGHWSVADGSVAALADALRRAVADIDAGRAVIPDPTIRDRFRQSSRTAAMVEVYRRVIR